MMGMAGVRWLVPALLAAGLACTPRTREAADRPVPAAGQSTLREAARAALRRAEARVASLGPVQRDISLPSVANLLDEVDSLTSAGTATRRDAPFLRRQLESAREKAEALATGRDPYRDAVGVMVKAYRSSFDGTLQPYALAVPRDYDAGRAWPLLVALHGAGSDHRDNLARVFGVPGAADDETVFQAPAFASAPMLVVSPMGRGQVMSYDGLGEEDVLRVLADVRRTYNVDPDRIYLTGLSMGGGGTWHLGLRHAELFAALVPVCGVVDPRKWIERSDRHFYDEPSLALQMVPAIAENAVNQRLFVYHGDADRVVPVDDSRRMVKRFQALGWLGKTVSYFELPGVAHNAWDEAYRDGNVFRLLADIRRDPFPPRVIVKTTSLRYGKAYWLRIDRIDRGGALAELTGEQHAGTFTVRADNVTAFSLLLDPSFVPAERSVIVRVAPPSSGGAPAPLFRGGAQPVLSFAREGNGWSRVARPVTGAPPEHAVVGLISRSLPRQRPHLYVYGTTGAPEANAEAQSLARLLSDWGPGVRARFAVKADREVTPADLADLNLVLVGSRRVNALVSRMAAALPLGDDATAGDRAYRLVAPNPLAPGRHVLIFGADSARALRRLARFAAPNSDAWAPEPNLDYILFDDKGAVTRSGMFRDDLRIR